MNTHNKEHKKRSAIRKVAKAELGNQTVTSHATNGNGHPLTKFFRKIAQRAGKILGSPWSFIFACLFVVVWAFSGRYFAYSNTWQLVINTSTTIVTFLMVFLIQNTQNRDTKALHLKLDELIYVHKHARNLLLEAEDLLDDDEIKIESEAFREKRENSLQ